MNSDDKPLRLHINCDPLCGFFPETAGPDARIGIYADEFTPRVNDGHLRYRAARAQVLLECMRSQLRRLAGPLDPRLQGVIAPGCNHAPAMMLVLERNGDGEILPYDRAMEILRQCNAQAFWPNPAKPKNP